ALHTPYSPSFPTRRSSDLLPAQPYWHLVLPHGPGHPHTLLRCRHKSEQSAAWKHHLVLPLYWLEPDLFQWDTGTTFLPQPAMHRSEEHTSELQSRFDLVCR